MDKRMVGGNTTHHKETSSAGMHDNESGKSTRDIDSSSSPLEYKLVNKESEAEDASIHAQAVVLLKKLKRNQELRLQAEEVRKKREKMEAKLEEILDAAIYLLKHVNFENETTNYSEERLDGTIHGIGDDASELSYESDGSDSDSPSVNYYPGKGRGSIIYQGLDRDKFGSGGESSSASETEELDSTSGHHTDSESTDSGHPSRSATRGRQGWVSTRQ